MSFRGLREYRTEDPKQLRTDLQRLEAALERSFQETDDLRGRSTVTKTNRETTVAHRALLFVDAAADVLVRLPASSSATKGLSVRVARRNGGQVITVVASGDDTVNGVASVQLASAVGTTVDLVDDGEGGFWGRI